MPTTPAAPWSSSVAPRARSRRPTSTRHSAWSRPRNLRWARAPRSRSSRPNRRKPPAPSVRRKTMADLSALVAAPPGVRSTARGLRTLGGQVDDEPIRAFLEDEYARVVATVALVCGSVATADDSVQEALARAWE